MAANLFQKGMKKLFFLLAAVVWLGSCGDDYDDSALRGRVDGLEDRIEQLEELCQRMNTNISSLQTLVEALQQNDYVTGVVPVMQGGETVGYTISFTKSEPVTIYHGEKGDKGDKGDTGATGDTGAAGVAGNDGHTPVMGVEEVDGVYYWTVDGEPLTDDDGNRIPASARDEISDMTPQFRIESGYWEISYDNGKSWQRLGQATGDKGDPGLPGGDSIFREVTQDDTRVYFTLADGSQIVLPKLSALAIEFSEGTSLNFDLDETKTVHYTITGGSEHYVVKVEMLNDDGGYTLRTIPSDMSGLIYISAAIPTVNQVIVSVSDGTRTILAAIDVAIKPSFDGRTVTVATPGTLADLLADYDKTTITELTVVGNLDDNRDIFALADLPNLSVLDMENVNLEKWTYASFLENETLTSVKLPKTLKVIETAFYGCTGLTGNLILPEGLTTIGEGTFQYCSGLTGNLNIPEGVTTIGDYAFSFCSGFTGSLILPEGLTTIGDSAFNYCTGFTGNLTIPEGVTTIGEAAFSVCSSLSGSLILPESLTSIGDNAFNMGSTGIRKIYCKSATPPQLLGDHVFGWSVSELITKCTLYVPVGCAEAYRTAPIWSDFSFKEIVETDFSELNNLE